MAVENRSLVGKGSLLWGYLHHTTLLSFGVGESSAMEAKRCGLAVNRPLFFSKGKAPPVEISTKKSQRLESK